MFWMVVTTLPDYALFAPRTPEFILSHIQHCGTRDCCLDREAVRMTPAAALVEGISRGTLEDVLLATFIEHRDEIKRLCLFQ
jgi:hypothetical protein